MGDDGLSGPATACSLAPPPAGAQTEPLLGSRLKRQARRDSDIDLLVEFESGGMPGFMGLTIFELELSELVGGVKVDLRTAEDLSRYFRDDIVRITVSPYEA